MPYPGLKAGETRLIRVRRQPGVSRPGRRRKRPVKNLKRRVRNLEKATLAWRQYQMADSGKIRSVGAVANGEPYHMKRLINPAAWTGVFQAEGEAANEAAYKYQMKNIKVRWVTQAETSTQTAIQCQVFIVSLKNASAQQFIQETTNGETLTVNKHYHHAPMDSLSGSVQGFGMYFLNKAYFNIHYTKKIRFGAQTTGEEPVTNLNDYTKSGYKHLTWKKELKSFNPSGSFRELPESDIQDTDRLYMYWFTNAEAIEQFISVNCQIVGQTVAGHHHPATQQGN